MACYHPQRAWRNRADAIAFRPPEKQHELEQLQLPCGSCIGCRMDRARDWAIRCSLELQAHDAACFATLTYNERYCPPSLVKRDLSAWVKRVQRKLRDERDIRFFGCGEYGEQNGRPHYHAIVYGTADHPSLHDAWTKGFVKVDDQIGPGAIAYVAGYATKKQLFREKPHRRTDPETGEEYLYQPPFILMSRRPGIGSHAREHWRSWRDSAIWHGEKVPVPRYLHEAWKAQASEAQLEKLKEEKKENALRRDTKQEQRENQELAAHARHAEQTRKRRKV